MMMCFLMFTITTTTTTITTITTTNPPPSIASHQAGLLRSEAPMRRRYFVLTGGKLYYFKAWEDYGSGGIGAAVNFASPIIAAEHEALALPAQPDGPNRFDLVHISDALARKWELQAASNQERADWLSVLRAARAHATASGAAPSASIDRANTLL